MTYNILLFLHIVGACVLLGTGAGIAFFMLISNKSKDAGLIAHTAEIVVLADLVFTATAAIAQPITGVLLAIHAGWSLTESWILASIGLYIFIGFLWLPVVWIQIQLRSIATTSHRSQTELPARYHKLYKIWLACGYPAFIAILAIFWLMINKPSF